MTMSMYRASVPIFLQMLPALSAVLDKAAAHAAAKKIDPQVFIDSRLYPDMFPLNRQIMIATDFAKGACALIAWDVCFESRILHCRNFWSVARRCRALVLARGLLTEDFVGAALGRDSGSVSARWWCFFGRSCRISQELANEPSRGTAFANSRTARLASQNHGFQLPLRSTVRVSH